MASVLDCGLEVNKFKLQSSYHDHKSWYERKIVWILLVTKYCFIVALIDRQVDIFLEFQ